MPEHQPKDILAQANEIAQNAWGFSPGNYIRELYNRPTSLNKRAYTFWPRFSEEVEDVDGETSMVAFDLENICVDIPGVCKDKLEGSNLRVILLIPDRSELFVISRESDKTIYRNYPLNDPEANISLFYTNTSKGETLIYNLNPTVIS